jgi:hypothetical protein
MNIGQAKRDLENTSFWFRGSRHRQALEYLAESGDLSSVDVLVDLLAAGHRQSQGIRRIFRGFTAPHDQPKIDRLWQRWLDTRHERLGETLAALGVPSSEQGTRLPSLWKLGRSVRLEPGQRAVRAVLDWLEDPDEAIRRGVLKTVEQLPDDEQLNDEIFEAWWKRESAELESLIRARGRKPARTELEALYYLVTGQPKLYEALGDENGEYFLQAFVMAPAGFRQRINDCVASSGNARLVGVYRKAMAGREGFDRQLYLDALKAAGDEDRLFESLREMRLIDSLDLCQRWSETGRLPQDGRRRRAAERAVEAYRAMGEMTFDEGPAPPDGLRDLFAVWEEQASPGRSRPDRDAKDPLVRARTLYRDARRGSGPDPQREQAAASDDWPVRLVARLLAPGLAAKDDHVEWIGAITGADAGVLEAPLLGTPDDYTRHSERLARAGAGGVALRSTRLLEVLCAFQGAFVSGGIIADKTDEATDRGAVTTEEAPVEDF